MPAADTAPGTVAAVVDEAQAGIDAGEPPPIAYDRAQALFRSHAAEDEITPAEVIEALEHLGATGMSVAACNALTGLCRPAARLTGDHPLAWAVAATHAAHSLQLISGLADIDVDQIVGLADDPLPPDALAAAVRTVRHADRAALVDRTERLDGLAADLGIGPALTRARSTFLATEGPVGPDCWAAFASFGGPRHIDPAPTLPKEEPWPAVE